MKKTLLLFLLTLVFNTSHSQVLRNTQLSLNAGGEVLDAVYIPQIKRYLLVGDFTSVNGLTRNKHAFLRDNGNLDSNLTLGISSVTGAALPGGAFYTVALLGNSLYIGGDIATMNTVSRGGLLKYTISGNETSPFVNNNTSSIPNLPPYTIIHDLENTVANTLCAVGYITFTVSSPVYYEYNNIFEFTNSGAISAKFGNGWTNGIGALGSSVINSTLAQVLYHNSEYYVSGQNHGFKYNASGSFVYTHVYQNSVSQRSKGFIALGNHLATYVTAGGSGEFVARYAPTNLAVTSSMNVPNVNRSGCSSNILNSGRGISSFNDKLYEINYVSSSLYQLTKADFSVIAGPSIPNFHWTKTNCLDITPNLSSFTVFDNIEGNHLFLAKNTLFVSSSAIDGAPSLSSKGLLQYCLEPKNPANFYNSITYSELGLGGLPSGVDLTFTPDSVVCSGQLKLYRIPPSEGAIGYKWKYTGTGLKYSFVQPFANAPLSFFNDLNDSIMSTNSAANGIWIYIADGFTLGQLSVTPYDVCNTSTDYLFATPRSVNFSNLPLPNIQIPDSLNFTCITDTLNLFATSSTPNVSYSWHYMNNQISNTASYLLTGSSSPNVISDSLGNFIVKVKNNLTGCIAKDTLLITDLKYTEPISASTNPLTYFCSTDSMILNATALNSTIFWQIGADSMNLFPNPLTIYNNDSINFKAIATNNLSSCVSSQSLSINVNETTIQGKLSSHPNYPAVFVTDTVSCSSNSVTFVCIPDPVNPNASTSSSQWIINGTLIGNSLMLSTIDSLGMNASGTKIYNFETTNGLTGCLDTFNVVIKFDLDKPYVDIYLGPSTTNCTYDTLTLSHVPTSGNVSQGWLNGITNTLHLDTLIQSNGQFIFEVIDNVNGCKSHDSTTVVQNQSMVLLGTPDTVVCPNLPYTISVNALNVTDPINYVWSNGSALNSSSGIGGIDTLLTVIATSSIGCTGYDTILVEVSAPVVADLQGFTECGSSEGSIQILTTTGGTGNYSYSIDNLAFSNATNFENLPMGFTYNIYIKDSLGCIYDFQTLLDASAQSPAMDFLVQTYNTINDTIVAVNISAYQGFDSLWWNVPSTFTILSINDSILVFQALDTGNFEVSMIAYQDTCVFEFYKSLRIDYFNPFFSNDSDTLGITNFSLYPNPTNGPFTVDITFGTTQNYSVIVLNDLGQPIPGMIYSGNGTNINLPMIFPVNIAAGVYRVRVIGEYDAKQQTILKQ